jgi:hypothetical protein
VTSRVSEKPQATRLALRYKSQALLPFRKIGRGEKLLFAPTANSVIKERRSQASWPVKHGEIISRSKIGTKKNY